MRARSRTAPPDGEKGTRIPLVFFFFGEGGLAMYAQLLLASSAKRAPRHGG